MTAAANVLDRGQSADELAPQHKNGSLPHSHNTKSTPLSHEPEAHSRPGANLQIDIVTTREAFNALEGDWTALYERAGGRSNIFQSYNWNWHWCNHYLDPKPHKLNNTKLAIVTVRRNNKLVMLWPTAIQPSAGLQQLMWMGDPVSQYGDVLCDAHGVTGTNIAELMRAAWDHIAQSKMVDVVVLRKVRDDALIAPFLKSIDAQIIAHEEGVSHNLAREENFDGYCKRFKRRAIRNRQRQMRRLEEHGAVEYKEHIHTSQARDITLQAIAMKREWLEQKGLVSRAYADTRFDDFFADIAGGQKRSSGCVVSVLSCGDTIAAVEIGLNDKTTRYMHIIVYNMKFEKFGTGAHHMHNSINGAFSSGLQTFDMLAPRTRYKTDWGDDIIGVIDYASGLNVLGRGYVWGFHQILRKNAKRVYAKMPAVLRRFLTTRK